MLRELVEGACLCSTGKHCYVLWRTNFEIDQHYQPIKAIGKGAYGVVCSAKNMVSGEKVAIKKIGNAFENLTDARRTLREIKLLRHLRHDNIIAGMGGAPLMAGVGIAHGQGYGASSNL